MKPTRISASSYLNTAPLVWSFLYGQNHGQVEIILDNAPARSAELLAQDRVDAALVPVFAYQTIDDVLLVSEVCVGARECVRSVCLVTKGGDLKDVRSVALDISSRSSAALTKIIFREFLEFEPQWHSTEPNIDRMLAEADCALIIGDPALRLPENRFRVFDLAEVWNHYTSLGFVFAMWMTKRESAPIDFAGARDEGLSHVAEIVNNYATEIPLSRDEIGIYLKENISYSIDESMREGMKLYFELAHKHQLIDRNKPLKFAADYFVNRPD
jgi:chorismate dehydratase